MLWLWLTLGIVGGLAVLFLIIGAVAPVDFEGKMTKTLPYPQEKIWQLLNDIEGLPKRRREVKAVEMHEPGENGQLRWSEIPDMGGFIHFEMLENEPMSKMTVEMTESSFGMKGTWSFTLEADGEKTHLTVAEKSRCEKLPVRAMMALAGRNSNIKREFKVLLKALA